MRGVEVLSATVSRACARDEDVGSVVGDIFRGLMVVTVNMLDDSGRWFSNFNCLSKPSNNVLC